MGDAILGINFLQIAYHLLNFFILGLGLYILLYKPVLSFIEKRTDHYKEIESNAKKTLEESEKVRLENQAKLDSVQDEIDSLKKTAIKNAELKANQLIENARQEEAKIIEKARVNASFEREKILKEAKNEIKNLVIDIVDKSTEEDDEDIFDAFIKASSEEA